MPLVKALRALLVLLALFAIVPTQTGGALAIDDLGFTAAEDRGAPGIQELGHKQNPAKPAKHATFAAPDDGTAAGAILPDWPLPVRSTLPLMRVIDAVASTTSTRLERPPKSA